MTEETLLLSQSDIEAVLTMKDVVEICDKTFVGFGDRNDSILYSSLSTSNYPCC